MQIGFEIVVLFFFQKCFRPYIYWDRTTRAGLITLFDPDDHNPEVGEIRLCYYTQITTQMS
jgi:hypothetical protein